MKENPQKGNIDVSETNKDLITDKLKAILKNSNNEKQNKVSINDEHPIVQEHISQANPGFEHWEKFSTDFETFQDIDFVRFFETYVYGSEFIEFEQFKHFDYLYRCTIIRRHPTTGQIISQEPTIILDIDKRPTPVPIPHEAFKWCYEGDTIWDIIFEMKKDTRIKFIIMSMKDRYILKIKASFFPMFCQYAIKLNTFSHRTKDIETRMKTAADTTSHIQSIKAWVDNDVFYGRTFKYLPFNYRPMLLMDKEQVHELKLLLLKVDPDYPHPFFEYVEEFYIFENFHNVDSTIPQFAHLQNKNGKSRFIWWSTHITPQIIAFLDKIKECRAYKFKRTGNIGDPYYVKYMSLNKRVHSVKEGWTFEKLSQERNFCEYRDKFGGGYIYRILHAEEWKKRYLVSPNEYEFKTIFHMYEIAEFMRFYRQRFGIELKAVEYYTGLWLFQEKTYNTPKRILVKNCSSSGRNKGYDAGLQTLLDLFKNECTLTLRLFSFYPQEMIREEDPGFFHDVLCIWMKPYGFITQEIVHSLAMNNKEKVNMELFLGDVFENPNVNMYYYRNKRFTREIRGIWKYKVENDTYEPFNHFGRKVGEISDEQILVDQENVLHPIERHYYLQRLKQDDPAHLQTLIESKESDGEIYTRDDLISEDDEDLPDEMADPYDDFVFVKEEGGFQVYKSPETGAIHYKQADDLEDMDIMDEEFLEEMVNRQGSSEDTVRQSSVFMLKTRRPKQGNTKIDRRVFAAKKRTGNRTLSSTEWYKNKIKYRLDGLKVIFSAHFKPLGRNKKSIEFSQKDNFKNKLKHDFISTLSAAKGYMNKSRLQCSSISGMIDKQ
ncbi:MAG: hypothetical protein GF364_15755, partial [Candidatus Lokiarchaeota archaeon]|nr:hypothetical protein [Candidatus Lokiarchaeota archaeon]